jgi:hypothetical protein
MFMDGTSSNVSTMVNWTVSPSSGTLVNDGNQDVNITVTAPGTYTITASSGSISATAALTAVFSGGFICPDLDTSCSGTPVGAAAMTSLDGSPSGTTTIAYPLDGSLFPANLGPIQVQTTTGGTSARINFQTGSGNVNVNFYGNCETGPGTGCYVTIPLALTQLLVPSSATEDIQITARVSSGGAPAESAPIKADWAPTGLTGGLYFWTVVPNPNKTNNMPTPPTYVLLDPAQTSGTQIERYNFAKDNPTPEVVWTDDGGPGSTPPYDGAPQAIDNGAFGGHCIGCHSITNDGKFMALTIGGSSTINAANWEMLDIANQALELINPVGGGGLDTNGDPNATPINDPTNYWKSYRKEAFGTETAWGPNSDVMVSMYASALYFNNVTVNGTSATVTRQGPAFPASATKIDPYQSDPFWSHDGTLFVYTSFNQASPSGGTNGDLKLNGQIAIADATKETVTDNARVLVSRATGVSSYYPCISEDSAYVVFNTSTCAGGSTTTSDPAPLGGGYGVGSCDGYDDASAELWWVRSSGGSTTRLDKANGGPSSNYDNSWPRFSPDVGTFRGNKLYWIAFSSRRPYGVQANTGGLATSQPQLWFAGVSIGEVTVGDPSFAAVWLPGQNPMGNGTLYGNHVPQWVKIAIVIDTGGI